MKATENEKLLKVFLASLGIKNAVRSGPYDYSCQCPLHDDRNPSFAISFHPQRWGVWCCYGCGSKGTFTDLSEQMGLEVEIEVPTPQLSAQIRDLLTAEDPETTEIEFPETSLLGEKQAVQYMVKYRQYRERVALQIVKTFRIFRGFGNWHRYLIFPIFNINQDQIGFTSRNLTSVGPKNRHPKGADKSTWLFGVNVCMEEFGPDEVILTEGPFDALRLYSYGYPAVATLGGPTKAQLLEARSLFSQIYTAFDGDEAGAKYRETVKNKIPAIQIHLPFGKDPDEISEEGWSRLWAKREKYSFRRRIEKLLRPVNT